MATLGRRKTRYDKLIKALVALILAGLFVQAIDGRRDGSDDPISTTIVFITAPVFKAGSAAHDALGSFWTALFSAKNLQEENEELRKELIASRIDTAARRSHENLASLSQEISTHVPPGTYDLMPVSILAPPPPTGRQVAWINAGKEDGVEKGMVALGTRGVVGEVIEVYMETSLVELVTDKGAVWGAEVDQWAEKGLVKGTGHGDSVEFHFDRTTFDAKPADIVVSSGMAGSIAPGGVPFGEIEEIRISKKGEPIAVLRLPEAPGELRTLFLLPHGRIPFGPKKEGAF